MLRSPVAALRHAKKEKVVSRACSAPLLSGCHDGAHPVSLVQPRPVSALGLSPAPGAVSAMRCGTILPVTAGAQPSKRKPAPAAKRLSERHARPHSATPWSGSRQMPASDVTAKRTIPTPTFEPLSRKAHIPSGDQRSAPLRRDVICPRHVDATIALGRPQKRNLASQWRSLIQSLKRPLFGAELRVVVRNSGARSLLPRNCSCRHQIQRI